MRRSMEEIHRHGNYKSSRYMSRGVMSRGLFVVLVTVALASGVDCTLAQDTENMQRVQQRNSYLDLWSNVFNTLDRDSVDLEVDTLENHVEQRMEAGGAGTTKHRLMDILEDRRKEKRSASLLKGLSRQHTIGPNLAVPGRMFGGSGSNMGSSGGGNSGVGGRFRQLGIPVENAGFESKLCFKMQNLGNADKYHGVILGSPRCDDAETPQDMVTSTITWKSDSMFLMDCSISSAVQNATESVGSIRAALKVNYDGSLPQAVSNRASCSLSVVSEMSEISEMSEGGNSAGNPVAGAPGPVLHSRKPSSAMLRLNDVPLPTDHAIDVAPLNAIKIKLCDLNSAWSTDATEAGGSSASDESKVGDNQRALDGTLGLGSEVALPTLKLNGKRLTSQELSAKQGSKCLTHTFRVPSIGLSNEGFVLSGSMQVPGARQAHTLGAGRASSVEISFGSASLIDATGS